jgi:hypothetical protein
VGDALVAMLRNNLSGTSYADNGMGWLPDLTLDPLYQTLLEMGFTGAEPTMGDVGGVGEIIAGGGPIMPRDRRFSSGIGQPTDSGLDFSGAQDRQQQAEGGAVGWDRLLRAFAGVSEDAPMPFGQSSGFSNVTPGITEILTPSDSGMVPMRVEAPLPEVSPQYLETLRAYDPGVAAQIEAALRQRADAEWVDQQRVSGGVGTG